jgi:hypothetical protein
MTIDYLLKFPSKQIAEQFGVANGFAVEVDGVVETTLATHEYALHEIGEHNGADYWFLFRDLVGIPVPPDADPFIYWASNQSIIDDVGDEIFFPRPEFNPDVPSVFWA